MNMESSQDVKEYRKKYKATEDGFLTRCYAKMRCRVRGIQEVTKNHLYKGKELLPKQDFLIWAKNDPEFHRLFTEFKKDMNNRKNCPSVDRIDSAKGYTLDNIRWVTQSENSRLGAISGQLLRKNSVTWPF